MGVFLDYEIAVVPGLSTRSQIGTGDPNIIVTADTQIIFVTDITICNLSITDDIRVNLLMEYTQNGVLTSAFRLKNVVIKASASTNLMQLLVDQTRPNTTGSSLILVGKAPSGTTGDTGTTTSLVLFTNSKTQQCDCTVTYAVANETPWGGC